MDRTPLGEMVIERLNAWKAQAGGGQWPEKILFFRDGVGEDQYADLQSDGGEIAIVEEAYQYVTKAKPRVTFAVVGKRHHTRFFPTDENKTNDACSFEIKKAKSYKGKVDHSKDDLNSNCKPGLLVDQIITAPRQDLKENAAFDGATLPHCPYDFYLQSHAAIKGTARSAHYVVLKNNANFTTAEFQNMVRSPKSYPLGVLTTRFSRPMLSVTLTFELPRVSLTALQHTTPIVFAPELVVTLTNVRVMGQWCLNPSMRRARFLTSRKEKKTARPG
jgi:hypothetical protein